MVFLPTCSRPNSPERSLRANSAIGLLMTELWTKVRMTVWRSLARLPQPHQLFQSGSLLRTQTGLPIRSQRPVVALLTPWTSYRETGSLPRTQMLAAASTRISRSVNPRSGLFTAPFVSAASSPSRDSNSIQCCFCGVAQICEPCAQLSQALARRRVIRLLVGTLLSLPIKVQSRPTRHLR